MLARALDRDGGVSLASEARACACRVALGVMNPASAVPMALAAPACEWAATEGVDASPHFAAALARRWLPAESDALRRIARAAVLAGDERAVALGELHARFCVREFAASAPLPWPLRTAGERLRVVLLVAAGGVEPPELAAFATRVPGDGSIDACVAVVGGAELPVGWTASDVLREARIIPLPVAPDSGDAKRIAALDPDVLVDFCGLDAAVGPAAGTGAGPAHRVIAGAGASPPRAVGRGPARRRVAGGLARRCCPRGPRGPRPANSTPPQRRRCGTTRSRSTSAATSSLPPTATRGCWRHSPDTRRRCTWQALPGATPATTMRQPHCWPRRCRRRRATPRQSSRRRASRSIVPTPSRPRGFASPDSRRAARRCQSCACWDSPSSRGGTGLRLLRRSRAPWTSSRSTARRTTTSAWPCRCSATRPRPRAHTSVHSSSSPA